MGRDINAKDRIREQSVGAESIYWTKLLSITTKQPSSAAVGTGWLHYRDVKQYFAMLLNQVSSCCFLELAAALLLPAAGAVHSQWPSASNYIHNKTSETDISANYMHKPPNV